MIAQHLAAHYWFIPVNSGSKFSTFYINLHPFPQSLPRLDEKQSKVQRKSLRSAKLCVLEQVNGRWDPSVVSSVVWLELVLLGCFQWAAVLLATASWVRVEG